MFMSPIIWAFDITIRERIPVIGTLIPGIPGIPGIDD